MVFHPIRFAVLFLAASFLITTAPPAARAADIYCVPIQIKCDGFEPNWNFALTTDNTLKFTDPENPDWQTKPLIIEACARPARNTTLPSCRSLQSRNRSIGARLTIVRSSRASPWRRWRMPTTKKWHAPSRRLPIHDGKGKSTAKIRRQNAKPAGNWPDGRHRLP